MPSRMRPTSETSAKILNTACQLFAEKGYRVTVATICRAAKVNSAAINYHFGNKETLYQQAWRYAFDQLQAKFSTNGGVAADRPTPERLRGIIRAGLQRAMIGDAIAFRIMHHEIANPTGLLHHVIANAIQPVRQTMHVIIQDLLGPLATTLDVELCEACTFAPVMQITHHRQAEKHQGLAPVFREEMLETMADRFTAFALAGIADMRRQIEESNDQRNLKKGRIKNETRI